MRTTAVLFGALSTVALTQTTDIVVRVLNAKNAKPVIRQKVSIFVKGQRDASEYVTDDNGEVKLELEPDQELIASTEWWVTCRSTTPTAPHFTSVKQILRTGFVDENNCGKARSELIRGKLILFARKASLAELFAK